MKTEKIAALWAGFSSSCGGLQPSTATVGPSGPTIGPFEPPKNVQDSFGKFCRNPFGKFWGWFGGGVNINK